MSADPSRGPGAPAGGVSPLCFALDFETLEEAAAAADRVKADVGMLKVGLELFVAEGARAVRLGDEVGLPVFLDLKLHDIPETVDRAVARAASLGVKVLTVHAAGGSAMLQRAVDRAREEGSGLTVAAVTVLTSLDARDLASMGVSESPGDQVERLARLAHTAGVRAFVCSVHEASRLRLALGPLVTLVTPGVRAASSASTDDQKRVATPAAAIAAGADWLVVGRPIRDAADPAAAARALREDARSAQSARSARS